jgi:hypothetical protein
VIGAVGLPPRWDALSLTAVPGSKWLDSVPGGAQRGAGRGSTKEVVRPPNLLRKVKNVDTPQSGLLASPFVRDR